MSEAPSAALVDARGLRCPWPALRLARAMREGAEAIHILADDPAAAGEFAALAEEQGWRIAPMADDRAPAFIVTSPTAP